MANTVEVKVPDIGGYDDVPVIEVLVAVGDTVAKDQGLVTLESDKATMEVPAPFAGVIRELKVKVGDAVSEGSVVAMVEASGEGAPADAAAMGFRDLPLCRQREDGANAARRRRENSGLRRSQSGCVRGRVHPGLVTVAPPYSPGAQ